MKATLKIKTELQNLLPKADEIWIAAAIISKSGLALIQDKIKLGVRQHYLVGIDLPTHPKVLEELMTRQQSGEIEAKLYFKKAKFFHPKLYILRIKNKLVAIVGSGNCTKGGLENNLEISVKIDDQDICKDLLKYFHIY